MVFKFTILVIVSIIILLFLFVILFFFNTILIFTKIMFYFKFISHFKPLLDAYQGPYKDRFYYWTGLQLVMRAVFFGLSALDRNTNLMTSLLLIGMIVGLYGILGPFRKKAQNIQELLILLYLNALFVMSLYTTSNAIAAQVLILIAVIQIIFVLFKNIKNQRFILPIVSAMAKIKTYF